MEGNFKNNEANQHFFEERTAGFLGKRGNANLIHPMSYKRQVLTYAVLQCLVDKYGITYQNNLGEDMVRPHLVELSYCKFWDQKKRFLTVAAIQSRISTMLKLTSISREK